MPIRAADSLDFKYMRQFLELYMQSDTGRTVNEAWKREPAFLVVVVVSCGTMRGVVEHLLRWSILDEWRQDRQI
jgi:hypothetical protein